LLFKLNTKIRIAYWTILGLTLLQAACVSRPSGPEAVTLKETTITPPASQLKQIDGLKLKIPRHLTRAYEIARKQAELRYGPGIQFPLKDRILTRDTLVLAYSQLGIWRKIYIPQFHLEGWVHKDTIHPAVKAPDYITVPAEALPLVFAKDGHSQVLDYKTKNRLSLAIPKGTPFHTLKKEGRMWLIYLPATQSIAWIHSRDVR
jgi:hypothetical protein